MPQSSSQQHKQKAAETGVVSITLITVSDSRTPETDDNGQYLKKQIEKSGHRAVAHHLIKDDPQAIAEKLEECVQTQAQIIIFNGGTGISRRDRTFDVLNDRFEKVLPGFGEIFRMLSYEQIGSAAMLSRAAAGVYKNKVIIAIPGSPQAVKLAWEKLIQPELQHLAWELTR